MVHTGQVASAVAAASRGSRSSFDASQLPLPILTPPMTPGELPYSPSPYFESLPGSTSARRLRSGRRQASDRPPRPNRPALSQGRFSSHRYQTFPTVPPKSPIEPPMVDSVGRSQTAPADETGAGRSRVDHDRRGDSGYDEDDEHGGDVSSISSGSQSTTSPTPLPIKQLALLAVLSLAEQTALNSIGPYLPDMVSHFPSHFPPAEQTGFYVGLLASSFAFAQLATNLVWGSLSDRVGRKPVMIAGSTMLCACFAVFGLCDSYAKLMAVHIAMGLLNGNAAVVPTCLGELTDRSNQSGAFTWLPVIYSLGGITGPAVGGLLVGRWPGNMNRPYLAPNVASAVTLAVAVLVVGLWFEETLETVDDEWQQGPGKFWQRLLNRPRWLCCCGRRSPETSERANAHLPSVRWQRRRQVQVDSASSNSTSRSSSPFLADPDEETRLLEGRAYGSADYVKPLGESVKWRQLFCRTTTLLLLTYLVFQLANVSFNSLYPIWASTPEPDGRDLRPEAIGLSLSLAGAVTMIFQIFAFQPLKARLGNLGTYRVALFGLGLTMLAIPWVGYVSRPPPFGLGSSRTWLYAEIGLVLIAKSIFAVGGLSCIMLLVRSRCWRFVLSMDLRR